jgi:hypothetical protein
LLIAFRLTHQPIGQRVEQCAMGLELKSFEGECARSECETANKQRGTASSTCAADPGRTKGERLKVPEPATESPFRHISEEAVHERKPD